MTSEFDRDLEKVHAGLTAAREELLRVVRSLSDADLDRGTRGGWQVRRILEHVTHSEQAYARIGNHLRSQPPLGDIPPCAPSSAQDAAGKLAASHQALLGALEGVDEETFYRVAPIGHEEYSVLSLLQNEVNHEREHAAQMGEILATTSTG
jgi:uncharacterized damage-inducible protein DinB